MTWIPAEQILARELAQHPKWKWERGMLAVRGSRLERVVWTSDDGRGLLCGTDTTSPEHYPDLADPATQGCLLAALGNSLMDVSCRRYRGDVRWTVACSVREHRVVGDGPALGEALARAWLAVQGLGLHPEGL